MPTEYMETWLEKQCKIVRILFDVSKIAHNIIHKYLNATKHVFVAILGKKL